MAAAMRKVRYERIHWLFRRFNESGRSLSHVFVTRNTFCTSKCHFYSKSLKKGWSESGTTQSFGKPQSLASHSFNRDVMSSKSRAKNRKHTAEEEEPDTDPENEDDEEMESKSLKSKRKFKSQKSGKRILRPSRYSFKDVRLGEEKENRWERRHGTEDKKGKTKSLKKGWSESGATQSFGKPRPLASHSFNRDVNMSSESRAKNRKHTEEEEEPDTDPETEDEEEMENKSLKSKRKFKSQKSGKIILRPSRYSFKDVRLGEEEENRWERRHGTEDKKGKTNWYARQMLRLTQEDKIEEALNLLASMKEDKLRPSVEVYNIFVSAYARRGQVRKAFKIFNDVKKRGMRPTAYTFSSLFHACSKATIPQHALKHVEKLLAEISKRTADQELEMNVITYNAAIQALVICGNPQQAFDIYQEMQDNNIQPDGHTFSSLLAACSYDKVKGPRVAFKILEEMKALQIQPDIFIFNSVLKVMRDFKVSAQEQKSAQSSDDTETLRVNSTGLADEEEGCTSAKQNDESLELHHHFPGMEKFIQMMAVENVHPDVRTFQLLLYMTSSKEEEEYLMELMKSCNISPDATFYNTMIKMKAMDKGLQEAKVYMQQLKETSKLFPSGKTYQALAHGCKSQKQGLSLLNEMKSERIRADQSVYGTLITRAAKQKQFGYLIQLLKRMTNGGVEPNDKLMEELEQAYNLPCNKPVITRTMDDRLVNFRKFRYAEQRGFQTFFENWKAKVLGIETLTPETGTSSSVEHYEDHSDERRDNEDNDDLDDETSDDDEDSNFSHL